METKKKKSIFKRKSFWIISAVTLTILMGGGCVLSMRNAMQRAQDLLNNQVKSAVVERQDIEQLVSGSGNLQVAHTVNTTAPNGVKVLTVHVQLGDRVHEGDLLADLDPDSILSQLADAQDSLDSAKETLNSGTLSGYRKEICEKQIETLKEKITALEQLRANPVIVSPADGIIEKLALEEGTAIGSASLSSLSGTTIDTGSLGFTLPSLGGILLEPDDEPSPEEPQSPVVITQLPDFTVSDPTESGEFQSEIPETEQYTGSVTWSLTDTAYLATVVLRAKEAYSFEGFTADGLTGLSDEVRQNELFDLQVSEDGTALAIAVPFAIPEEEDPETTPQIPDLPVLPDISDLDLSKLLQDALAGAVAQSIPSTDGMDLSALYGASLTQDYLSGITGSALGSSLSSVYSGTDAVVCVIDTMQEALITVQIDEQDILYVEEGQHALVTLDALEYKEFQGTITRVAATASSTSGSTKYPVEISIKMQDNMRFGMSASAQITVGVTENALTIPLSALQQTGEQTFVYLELTKDQEPTGEQPVVTGLSDGNIVEILSGLSEGDTVYYTQLDANPFEAFFSTEEE